MLLVKNTNNGGMEMNEKEYSNIFNEAYSQILLKLAYNVGTKHSETEANDFAEQELGSDNIQYLNQKTSVKINGKVIPETKMISH